jgi:hypothetical protein
VGEEVVEGGNEGVGRWEKGEREVGEKNVGEKNSFYVKLI